MKNVRVPESSVFGLSDMHEEKNIDTVIQSIYRLRGRGKLDCSGSWCSSFQLSFGCISLVLTKIGERLAVKTRDDCSEEYC